MNQQFNKIKIVDYIANCIANYGVQNGYEQLFDKLDLSCGAVPEGDISQVIDLSAPEQFLSLYTQIVENRLAMSVCEVLKMNKGFFKPILDFCNSVGTQMQISEVLNADEAFAIYNNYVLDGMPGEETKKIEEKNDNSIRWTKLIDTHEKAWKKAEGDLFVYYQLLEAFVNGLFINAKYKLRIENNAEFVLEKVF